jgi:hypothetical protein
MSTPVAPQRVQIIRWSKAEAAAPKGRDECNVIAGYDHRFFRGRL